MATMFQRMRKQRSRINLDDDPSRSSSSLNLARNSTASIEPAEVPPLPALPALPAPSRAPTYSSSPASPFSDRAPTYRSSPPAPDSGASAMPVPLVPTVVLNWTPAELYEEDPMIERQREAITRMNASAAPSTDNLATSVSTPEPVLDNLPDVDADQMPPRYEEARFPTSAVTYTFSPSSANSMLLIPPPDHPDSRPLYHISVSQNCWIPSAYITKIVRGGTQDGEEVGDFEMGVSIRSPTVCLRRKEHLMNTVLTEDRGKRVSGVKTKVYQWRFLIARVYWEYSTLTINECKLHSNNTVLARFQFATGLRGPDHAAPLSTLEVLPPGFRYLDDIVVSILAIERKRHTPAPPPAS